MNVPYNTGRVLIGVAYTPGRKPSMSVDAERLQAALLRGRRTCSRNTLAARAARFLRRFVRWILGSRP